MLPRLFAPALALGCLFCAADAQAAKFRLQGASPSADGTFSVAGLANGRISGEFSVLSDYRDKNGNVVNAPGKELQAWNITVKDGGTVRDRFVGGYSAPVMGALPDNSSKSSEGPRQFTLTCTDASASPTCTAGNTFTLAFAVDFDTFIGNSTGGTTCATPVHPLGKSAPGRSLRHPPIAQCWQQGVASGPDVISCQSGRHTLTVRLL